MLLLVGRGAGVVVEARGRGGRGGGAGVAEGILWPHIKREMDCGYIFLPCWGHTAQMGVDCCSIPLLHQGHTSRKSGIVAHYPAALGLLVKQEHAEWLHIPYHIGATHEIQRALQLI